MKHMLFGIIDTHICHVPYSPEIHVRKPIPLCDPQDLAWVRVFLPH